jgi:hypothetical protein
MKSRSKLILGIVYPRLDIANKLLSTVMDKDNTLTDKEYNFIREAHDYISNARDILERLTKQKLSNKEGE